MDHSSNKYSILARWRDRLCKYTFSDSYRVSITREENKTPSCVESSTEGTPFTTMEADSQSMKLYLPKIFLSAYRKSCKFQPVSTFIIFVANKNDASYHSV